jgi:hypothetical protein
MLAHPGNAIAIPSAQPSSSASARVSVPLYRRGTEAPSKVNQLRHRAKPTAAAVTAASVRQPSPSARSSAARINGHSR